MYVVLMPANDEPTPGGPEPTLAEKAAAYYNSEFNTNEVGQLLRKDEAEDKISELSSIAIKRMEYLLNHAESESVVWQVSKYILDTVLKKDTEDDELRDMLKRIAKKQPTQPQ